MVLRNSDEINLYLGSLSDEERRRTAVWLLCHYPETKETTERCETAALIVRRWKVPVWLFGSLSARYPETVEKMMRDELISFGVPKDKILCSEDIIDEKSLDTVQELHNVVNTAKRKGIVNLICVSNPLQLLQVHGFVKGEEIRFVYVPTALRELRMWYLGARLALIPFAYAKVGMGFGPLKLVRHARANWKKWPF